MFMVNVGTYTSPMDGIRYVVFVFFRVRFEQFVSVVFFSPEFQGLQDLRRSFETIALSDFISRSYRLGGKTIGRLEEIPKKTPPLRGVFYCGPYKWR